MSEWEDSTNKNEAEMLDLAIKRIVETEVFHQIIEMNIYCL